MTTLAAPNPFTQAASEAKSAQSSTATFIRGAEKLPNGLWKVPGLGNAIDDKAYARMVEQMAQEDLQNGVPSDELSSLLRSANLGFAIGNGRVSVSGFNQARDNTPVGSPAQPQPGTTGSTLPTPGGGGGGSTGGGGYSGGGGGGGGGGGAGPGWFGGGVLPPNQGGTTPPFILPGAGGGPANIDPSAPLGMKPVTPQKVPGSSYFGASPVFPSAGNPFQGLDQNSNLYDVISKVAGAQVGNQQSALDILGGVFNESQSGANSTALRGGVNTLLANPYSLDEGTIASIVGKTTERANNAAANLGQLASARAASAGLNPDSGVVQAQQGAFQASAAKTAADAERDTRIQAAMQNKQDLRSALGTAGQAIDSDLGRRERIGGQAALGVLGETAITGDQFLTNALLAAQGKPVTPVAGVNYGRSGGPGGYLGSY